MWKWPIKLLFAECIPPTPRRALCRASGVLGPPHEEVSSCHLRDEETEGLEGLQTKLTVVHTASHRGGPDGTRVPSREERGWKGEPQGWVTRGLSRRPRDRGRWGGGGDELLAVGLWGKGQAHIFWPPESPLMDWGPLAADAARNPGKSQEEGRSQVDKLHFMHPRVRLTWPGAPSRPTATGAGTTQPGPGCQKDGDIEVRQAGVPVPMSARCWR